MAEREFDNHKDIGGRVMGEHKHNSTAIAAKNGELPPKKKANGHSGKPGTGVCMDAGAHAAGHYGT